MNVRRLLVAASAVAILAGTSLSASAGSFSFSKGESSSHVVSVGTVIWHTPVAVTIQGQHNESVAVGNGGASASAGTDGGAFASTSYWGSTVAAGGSTSGSSCAGSNCGSN